MIDKYDIHILNPVSIFEEKTIFNIIYIIISSNILMKKLVIVRIIFSK